MNFAEYISYFFKKTTYKTNLQNIQKTKLIIMNVLFKLKNY